MRIIREKLTELDPAAAEVVLRNVQVRVLVLCRACNGTGEDWSRREYAERCWWCYGSGIAVAGRMDMPKLRRIYQRVITSETPVETLRAIAMKMASRGPRTIVSDEVVDLAADLLAIADEAEMIQEDIGGQYRGEEPFGSSDYDDYLARIDVKHLRALARKALEGEWDKG